MERYACILWNCEKAYSHVEIKKIIHNLESTDVANSLVDNSYYVNYSSDEPPAEATVIGIDSRAKMSKLAADLACEDAERSMLEHDAELPRTRSKKEALSDANSGVTMKCAGRTADGDKENESMSGGKLARKSKKRKCQADITPMNEVVTASPGEYEILPEVNAAASETTANQSILLDGQDENRMEEKEAIRQLKARNEYQRKRIRNLERQLCEQHNENLDDLGEPEKVKLADKIYVSKSVVRDLKLYYRANPGSFLRRLLERGGLFTLEEIASSSVLGKPSSHGVTRNPLDPIKFKAAKDFTIKKCRLKPGTVQMFSFEKSIVNICTDARKKMKRLEAVAINK